VAYLTRQLSLRLAYQERQARQSRQAARTHAQVNSLIIANLSEGVLVVDAEQQVRLANPAACELLGLPPPLALHNLHDMALWQPLRDMVAHTYASGQAQTQHVHLLAEGERPVGLYVRTWLTTSLEPEVLAAESEHDGAGESLLAPHLWLCVIS